MVLSFTATETETDRRAEHRRREEAIVARQQTERELVWTHLAEPGTVRQLEARTGLDAIPVMAALNVMRETGSVTRARDVFSRMEGGK